MPTPRPTARGSSIRRFRSDLRSSAFICGYASCCFLAACSTNPPAPTTVPLAAPAYPAAFDAAKQVLRDNNFTIDRFDARAGVITTRPKTTGGFATPWDGEQSTVGQEFAEAVNRRARTVRVTFFHTGAGAPPGVNLDEDLRDSATPLTLRVSVDILSRERPGWRVDSSAINLSSYTSDPALAARGMEPLYEVVIDHDDALAARLAQQISDRAGLAADH